MEIVIEVLANFSEFYINIKDLQKAKIEGEFDKTYETTRKYLDSRSDNKPSVSSIDFDRMNIINDDSETLTKTTEQIADRTFSEIGALDQIGRNRSAILQPSKPTPCHLANEAHQIQFTRSNTRGSRDFENIGTSHLAEHKQKNSINTEEAVVHETGLIPNNKNFLLSDSFATPSIGQDLWMQLKRVQIPIFSGDKRTY